MRKNTKKILLDKPNSELDSPEKLKKQYKKAMSLTLNKEKTKAFFEEQQLSAIDIDYGQNQKGKYLYLEFNDAMCEQWWLDAK